MKISIVTISYNQASFIEEAIRSITEQDGADVEYIVVDPGSTDGSRAVIDRYRDRIAATVYERDDGPADGLNKGFALATGDVLGFINADDVLLPGALGRIAAYFSENPEVDAVCGCGWIVDGEGRRIRRIVPTHFSKRLFAYGAVTLFQQGVFFRRSAFLETGGFNRENRTCWDGELFLDMAANGCRFGLLFEDIAAFRIHGASISGSGRLEERYRKDLERLFAKVVGRERNAGDRVLAKVFRLEKWLVNPRATAARLAIALGSRG
ncbi:MAG: glycosyltransferase family 2 protein [Actinomycetota bacterium]